MSRLILEVDRSKGGKPEVHIVSEIYGLDDTLSILEALDKIKMKILLDVTTNILEKLNRLTGTEKDDYESQIKDLLKRDSTEKEKT